jgi:hypothetical protein
VSEDRTRQRRSAPASTAVSLSQAPFRRSRCKAEPRTGATRT